VQPLKPKVFFRNWHFGGYQLKSQQKVRQSTGSEHFVHFLIDFHKVPGFKKKRKNLSFQTHHTSRKMVAISKIIVGIQLDFFVMLQFLMPNFIYLFIFLFIYSYLFIYLSIYLFIFIYLFTYLSIYLFIFIYLSIYLFIFIYLFVYLFTYLFICLFTYLVIFLFFYLG